MRENSVRCAAWPHLLGLVALAASTLIGCVRPAETPVVQATPSQANVADRREDSSPLEVAPALTTMADHDEDHPSEVSAAQQCPAPEDRDLQTWRFGEVLRGDPLVPQMALTFDAGAGSGTINELLDVLRDRNVHATFFIAGAFADRYPAIVARIAEEGHELANHSYSHPDFRTLSERQMRVELQRGTAAIETASGTRIAPLWRPPFGSRDERILQIVRDEGFRSIYWTFDSGDWIVGATSDGIIRTVLQRASNGAVVVHHVSPQATARAMPIIIDRLQERGFDLVTVSELMGYRAGCLPHLGDG